MYPSFGQNGTASGESLMAKCFSIVYSGYPPHRSHPAVSAAGCVFAKATLHKCQNQICRRKHDIEFCALLFKPSVSRLSEMQLLLDDTKYMLHFCSDGRLSCSAFLAAYCPLLIGAPSLISSEKISDSFHSTFSSGFQSVIIRSST